MQKKESPDKFTGINIIIDKQARIQDFTQGGGKILYNIN